MKQPMNAALLIDLNSELVKAHIIALSVLTTMAGIHYHDRKYINTFNYYILIFATLNNTLPLTICSHQCNLKVQWDGLKDLCYDVFILSTIHIADKSPER